MISCLSNDTLEKHGIKTARSVMSARYLDSNDFAAFSQFVMISTDPADRIAMLCVPDDKCRPLSCVFFGIRDPAYESSYDQAYTEIFERMDRLFRLMESGNGI